ncbi:8-oxo-dGTP diphosphatase [Streptococcus mutans]|uniref:8-oxo-dGTP diphosphatase n=1 Tax=Streptococcus mutans TaxID=1309 RepID=UPI0002B59C49|nr:8-oxo-dGTP diphosphatase [Streptococcus mutans]RKV71560.1 MAG: 8-oxo-dGTP diphosphatase [Streptococcus sp.]EMB89770.1 putative MutT-like protein [Streptococcus mutans NMT4863]EMC03976.1 putative MutT-like protein [Streptococcus mutans NFSM1]MCB4934146.1 8-oxo-dGTP diphosphatase [Streptococcus mutans]MCB4936997.1 8-oxo-dGTP diphosphatase [Streptococcus mutans]
MSRTSQVILTNMCLIEDGNGNIVMQIRDPKRYSWSGAALPGGHIEEHEGLVESVIREVKEETGLTIHHPQLVGMKHWYTKEDVRYLVFLYRTSDFEGDLQSSDEGQVRWVARKELAELDLAYDMLNLLRVFEEKNLSELFYRERLADDFVKEFW